MRNYDTPIPELGNRSWAELEVVTSPEDGHMLVRDQIRERDPKTGEWKAIAVRVRIPRPGDNIRARVEARAWFAEMKHLDAERDEDLFKDMEQLCLLSRAIRTSDPPHPQVATRDEMLNQYDEASLQDVLGRLAVYRQMLDPREAELTEEEVWQKIIAVARVGHLGPLTDIAGHEQPSFVLSMAQLALLSPMVRAFAQSCGISTPEPSGSKSSVAS